MRYAITGATGFLGGELARQLLAAGHEVVALVRDPARAEELRSDGARLVVGDLDDADALDRLLDGADGFFHVAACYKHGRRHHDELRHANVVGTRNALEAARRADVRTVLTSSTAVNGDTRGAVPDETHVPYGQWATEYDRTKAEAHRLALEYADAGLPLVIVMPSVIYGPGDTASTTGQLVRQVLDGKPTLVPRDGECCWTHVEDVARGHVLAMERGRAGEAYLLAGDRATYAEVLALVADEAGRRRPVPVPHGPLRLVAALTAPLERLVPVPQVMTAESARAGMATYLGDSGKARDELGWTARPLREGMREVVRAERAERR